MTSSRYLIERVAQAFGYQRKTQRLSDAASEMHLLREAEARLGESIWANIENIEALSNEYWSIRKLSNEQKELKTRLDACQQRLDEANSERASLLVEHSDKEDPELVRKRGNLLTELENLAKKRDEVISEGRTIRRLYNGAKTKLEVLSLEGDQSEEEIKTIKGRLAQLKTRFAELKNLRDSIAEKITEGDNRIDALNHKIQEHTEQNQEVASDAFKVINQVNKEVWQLRAETGLIDTRMQQLYAEIGRYISRNASHDSRCAAAAASQQGLVDVMRALRRSIALNHRLAGTL